ncbi:hypothetical protein MF545_01150, partial [Stenotrophomonas maltophilia]|nr:hypothetical protein [Stenotrophomonas maltophilia]
RTHPAFDSFLLLSERHSALVGVDLGRHGGRHERLKDRLLILIFLILPVVAQETVRGREGGLAGGVSRMGPRHASGGLGRTPNPGLAVCAGRRTRASGDRAYMDVLAAAPSQPTLPADPEILS